MVLVILKLLIVLFFLLMFIRRPNIVWGVGLLTVTTAVLLDTLLGTFNREELLGDLGFFFYVIAGMLLAGGAFWLWGLLRPRLGTVVAGPYQAATFAPTPHSGDSTSLSHPTSANPDGFAAAGIDRQMLFDEVHKRFGRGDVEDLMFDVGINELDVAVPGQNMDELIVNIMDAAERDGKAYELSLAIERILTPPPPENLPRLDKITADSPPTILRHYLLAHYSLAQLKRMAAKLGIDWEQLPDGDKKDKVRGLLLYLYRRDRINDLLQLMVNQTSAP